MVKPAGAITLLLVIAFLAILSSSASAQSVCATGTALMNQANAQDLTDDCDTLLSARDTLAGTGTLNWSASLAIEEWDGVSVDGTSRRVTGLDLRAARLDGRIAVELSNLDHLESLHLGENQLNGEIPAELGRLDALQELYLNANELTGDIPAELGGLDRLQRMYLNGNQLDGGVPPSLGGLDSIRVLSLSQNRLVGEIPVELRLLGSLRELYLNANRLSGEIPAELGDLSSLENLYLNGNQLTGMIPTVLGSLTNLRRLSLSQNQLTGEIPSELGGLTSLQSLYLDGNRLDGMIPTALGSLANLQHLQLGGNQLTGCVPNALLGAIVDAQPLDLPACEAPATPGSLTVVIDLDGPRAPVRFNAHIGLTAAFSQSVSDFTADDISLAFGTVANFDGTGPSYTFDVTPSAPGPVTVDIPAGSATDASGNGNAAANQLLLGIPYDDNNDAGISKSEAIAAVVDYLTLPGITKAQTIGIINLYLTSPVVVHRVANAGPDAEALESGTVMLDGTATTGPEGSISFYRWEQVINGSRLVSLTGTDTAGPAFTLPGLSDNQDFVFRLTVTYNNGETSQVEVTITGRPSPGVIVGAVSGHTAVLNAVAEFVIRLRSRPSADVVIPIFSSNESEGVPEQTEVVFTPENWQEEQIVSVRGQNANVRGGVQSYEIILGDTQSADSFYEGLEVANVAMKGISLEIMGPERLDSLIANIRAVIQPGVSYTGSYLLSYALVDAPEGMSIDFNNGTIFWIPAESDEGQTFNVTVRVNDGALFAETTFSVVVVAPQEIETEIIESEVDGNELTVTDEDTDVNGLAITSPPDEVALNTEQLEELQEALGKVAPESVPEIPSWITRISDVFVVKGSFDHPVKFSFPLSQFLGQQLDDSTIGGINLYVHVEPIDSDEPMWIPASIERTLEGTVEDPVYVFTLGGMQGLSFFGYHSTHPTSSSDGSRTVGNTETRFTRDADTTYTRATDENCLNLGRPSICVAPPSMESVECERAPDFLGAYVTGYFRCTYSADNDVKMLIGPWLTETLWGDVTVEDVAMWAITAQLGFDELGMMYPKAIVINLLPLPINGIVVPVLGLENQMFISDDGASSEAQGTVVHEYLHLAQGSDANIVDDGKELLFARLGQPAAWLVEGTARWFEDELGTEFDQLNTYVDKEGNGLRILEEGLNSGKPLNPIFKNAKRPYQRFSFFKLVTERCSSFPSRLKDVFQADIDADSTGLFNFLNVLDELDCDFGNHLGQDRSSSLAAALTYYNYATQFKNKMSLLDENELSGTSEVFRFEPPRHSFSPNLGGSFESLTPGDTIYRVGQTHKLRGVHDIPPAGAYSFNVLGIGGSIPAGQVAELSIDSGPSELIVSVTSSYPNFEGGVGLPLNTLGPEQDPHVWFSTRDRTNFIYEGSSVPQIFVTLVNPDPTAGAVVSVVFRIKDDTNLYPSITSHSDGEQVSNRVISITGSIPEEVRDEVDRVVITANGLETDTDLRSDGTFSEQVLMFLGNNVITAQGVTGNTAVTELASITLEGVEGSSSGRNQLVSTRVGFVLRWDTDRTDVDLYSTDQFGSTIWYREKVQAPGFLDVDDVWGLGPEVISYRSPAHDVFVDGTFDVDVHYYRGTPATNFTLDVILNETDGNNRRLYRYRSITPLTDADGTASNRPTGASGTSRFNDIVKVRCSGAGVCQMSQLDHTKLASVGETGASHSVSRDTGSTRSAAAHGDDYEQCMRELKLAQVESQSSKSSCGEAEAEEGVQ